MDIGDHFTLEHLLFSNRVCRACGVEKDLINDFYLTRKNKISYASSYSYECKLCTVKRITLSRKRQLKIDIWEYPDW